MRLAAAYLAALLCLAGCADSDGATTAGDDRGAGVGALGADARVATLARASLRAPPPADAVWVADEFRLTPGRMLGRGGEFAFVYARSGEVVLQHSGASQPLAEGEAAAGAGRRGYSAEKDATTVWEIRLASRGSPVPKGARRLFESAPLEGLPERPALSFLSVTVPPRGGRTTVHTHPGPELVYELSGTIDYQNALIGTRRLGPGGLEGIPADTPVQKRNPYRQPAVFLSWFALDPDEPFASKASF